MRFILAGEHQLEQRRVARREAHIRGRGRAQPGLELIARPLDSVSKLAPARLEPGLGEGVQQRLAVGEVAARRAVLFTSELQRPGVRFPRDVAAAS